MATLEKLLEQAEAQKQNGDNNKLSETYREIAKIFYKQKNKTESDKYNRLSKEAKTHIPEKEKQINASFDESLERITKMSDSLEKVEEIKKILKKHPNWVEFNGIFGDLYRNLELYEEAREQYEIFLEKYSGDDKENFIAICNNYANLLTNHFQEYGRAKKFYERAIKLNPKDANIYNNYATFLIIHFQEHDKAKELFEKAIELEPDFAEAHNNYAALLTKHFQEHDKAKEYYEKAIELNPKDANIYNNYANLLTEKFQEHDKAKEFYEKAIELNPKDAEVHNNYALLLTKHFQEHDKAKELFEKAIELNPQYADAYYNYANLLTEKFQEHDKAKEFYEKAIEFNPKYAKAHHNLAVLYFDEFEDIENAQKHFLLAIEIDPDLDFTRTVLGETIDFSKQTYISEFEIKNVRHHKDLKIEISDKEKKHLFLTGKNGSGKTSILKEAQKYLNRILEIPINEIFTEKGKREFWQDTDDYKLKFNVKQNLLDLRLKYESGDYTIVYFDDFRKLNPKVPERIDNVILKKKYLPNENISANFVEYLIHRDYMHKSGEESDDILELFDRINSILKKVYKEENVELKLNAKELDFYIKLPNGNEFTFNQLSMGFSAVLKIIFEIIIRTQNKVHKMNSEGIVLIDEPESHLHIEMQEEILPMLIELFPNMQFVVATHSPQILSSVPNSVVYDLETKIRTERLSKIPLQKISENYLALDKENVRKTEAEMREFISLINLLDDGEITEEQGDRIAELDLKLNSKIVSDSLFGEFKKAQKKLY